MSDILFTTSQSAEFLGVTSSRIRQLILEGRLPATKVGRDYIIKLSDLEEFSTTPRTRTGRNPKA